MIASKCLQKFLKTIALTLFSYSSAQAGIKMADGGALAKKGEELKAVELAVEGMVKPDPKRPDGAMTNPKLIQVYVTGAFDINLVAETLQKKFPNAELLGFEAFKAVITSKGYLRPDSEKEGAIALMGWEGDFQVATAVEAVTPGLQDNDKDNAEKERVIKKLISSALANIPKDVKPELQKKPNLVIMHTARSTTQTLIDNIAATFSPNVQLSGGTPLDSNFQDSRVIAKGKATPHAAAIALIYTDKKIGSSFHGGYTGDKKQGVITSMKEGNRGLLVQTIDNRPALEVYNEWAKGEYQDIVDKIKATGKEVIEIRTAFKPLAKGIKLPDGDIRYIMIQPYVFFPDGSFKVALTVHKGETLYYVEGNANVLVKRTGVVAERAMANGKIKKNSVAGGFNYYCAGAWAALEVGKDRTPEIFQELKAKMPGPFILAPTGGEQGNATEGGNIFEGNLMSTMVVLEQ